MVSGPCKRESVIPWLCTADSRFRLPFWPVHTKHSLVSVTNHPGAEKNVGHRFAMPIDDAKRNLQK